MLVVFFARMSEIDIHFFTCLKQLLLLSNQLSCLLFAHPNVLKSIIFGGLGPELRFIRLCIVFEACLFLCLRSNRMLVDHLIAFVLDKTNLFVARGERYALFTRVFTA